MEITEEPQVLGQDACTADGPAAGDDPPMPSAPPEPSDPSGSADPSGLSERERLILSFERRWWRYAGVKEQAIRETFGLSPTRYYQALNALLDRPEALAHEPVLVNRLRRLRVARQRARSGRRTGTDS
jgi:hypothetical protein